MKTRTNRFLSALMAVVVVFTCMVRGVFAVELDLISEETKTGINNTLSSLEPQKENFGLNSLDFSDIEIGEPIHCYEYTSNGFHEILIMYPLACDNQLIAMATPNGDVYQINNYLSNKLKEHNIDYPIAIVYDYDSCYAYDETNGFAFLMSVRFEVENRLTLPSNSSAMDTSELQVAGMRNFEPLNYAMHPSVLQSETYIGCEVLPKLQPAGSDICWAAIVACIVDKHRGYDSLSAVDVAMAYFGSTDYDHAVNDVNAVQMLAVDYSLPYSIRSYIPSDSAIATNLLREDPLYVACVWSGGRHAVCLYGIDAIKGYAYVMDPEYGFDIASYNSSGYRYYNPEGVLLTFDAAGAVYWG